MRTISLANQYDLRPAADAIMQAIDERLKSLPKNETLYVVMGESHNRPSHILLRYLIASRLLDRENADPRNRFALGEELPAGLLSQTLPNIIVNGKPLKNVSFDDPSGEKTLMSICLSTRFVHTPISNSHFNLFAYFNRIAFSCNDGMPAELSSVMADPQASPDEVYRALEKTLPIRNYIIATNATLHAERTAARVYLQQAGSMHLFGGEQKENGKVLMSASFEGSLAGIFADRGLHGLYILPTEGDELLAHTTDDALVIEGLENDKFSEEYIIDKIYAASGSEIKPWNIDLARNNIKEELAREIPHWFASGQAIFSPN